MAGAVIAATALAGAVLCVKGVSRGIKVQSLAGIFLLVAAGLWYIFSAMPARHREATFRNMRSYGNVAPVKGGLFDTEDPEIVKRENAEREESGE